MIPSESFDLASKNKRIERLDVLRGIAILGMLVANIPWHVGNSMSRVHDPDMTSVTAWLMQYLIFDQRFMPFFCFLFGASFYISSMKVKSFRSFKKQYLKRMSALMVIGIAHAYLVWPGDILITYAVCGSLLLLFYRCSITQMVFFGVLLKIIGLIFGEWPEVYSSTIKALLFSWWVDYGTQPSTITEAYSGSYSELFTYNAWRNQFLQWTALPYFRIWNALGLMLIGIALFRMQILQGNRSEKFYRNLIRTTLFIGTPLIIYGVLARVGVNPSVGPWLNFTHELPLHNITHRTGCLITSVSLIGLFHLHWNKMNAKALSALKHIGQMALTNYLLQSIVFLMIFHSFALIAFDTIDHDVMFLLVLGMWFINTVVSNWWMNRYRRGPVELIYRVLSK